MIIQVRFNFVCPDINTEWKLDLSDFSAMEFLFDHCVDKREKIKKQRERIWYKKICKFVFVVFATFFQKIPTL